MEQHKHIICYSNGVQSASVAVAVVEKYGKDNCILLNHAINPGYEPVSVTNFGLDIAKYLKMKITYANHKDISDISKIPNQFDVCVDAKSFVNPKNRQILCTNRLKTAPFMKWLERNDYNNTNSVIYYGFTIDETKREERRESIMCSMGYETAYPLIRMGISSDYYKKTGIPTPEHYKIFKHGNCYGCLKAGKQHWYIIYCLYKDKYFEGVDAEKKIGYSIHKKYYLKDFIPEFKQMIKMAVEPTEHVKSQTFWANTRRLLKTQL
ncbi:MAG: hypothetical protein GWP19_00760 [Planctomycetia bacterium]|nr:hypothetical protein [Planctomycetia bacterium]